MRVIASRQLRVGPGDLVEIRGQLRSNSRLARLFVFAREGNVEFSPYVVNVKEKLMVVGDKPQMYSPMSMRLDSHRSQHAISFASDIDGYVKVMQEVDCKEDQTAKVTLKRKINPDLPWHSRVLRWFEGMSPWSR